MSFLEAAKEGSQPHGDDMEALGSGGQEVEGSESGDFLKRKQHKHIFPEERLTNEASAQTPFQK